MEIEKLHFLTPETAKKIAEEFSTPCYVYSEEALATQARKVLAFPNAFGLTPRYAMKASSNANILKLFDSMGLHFDASSAFEVERAMLAGIKPERISLSSQQLPENLAHLNALGVKYNACSLRQLEEFGKSVPSGEVGVRINPGLGSGGTNRTNVGGPASSFGIWHEYIPRIFEISKKYGLKIIRIHTHIGSGSDPLVWQKVAKMSLDSVRRFPDVKILNMGGGFKVGRMIGEKSTDLQEVGAPVAELVKKFAEETGRKLHFEIEPGTFLLANCACLLAEIQDICDTGSGGYTFLKLNSGMTEILRPSLYGAQHPIVTIPQNPTGKIKEYIVSGHCCESGDILTPASADPEGLAPRPMQEAQIGDLCAIGGAGAYCSSMPAKNYNSYPEAPEVMVKSDGSIKLMRRRQTLEQIIQNEVL
ncbi:MAG: diaminopimelate decarboxylase [Opitutales bacterium]|nr:diaminopimelate decarboxylase [Opitutales bacterium]